MTERAMSCDDRQLQLLLGGDLPAELEAVALDHIAACHRCQRELDLLAGDEDWWGEVKTCFSDHADKLAKSRKALASQASTLTGDSGVEDSFATDFAVDFLQPCDQPETLGRLDDIEILEVIGRGGMGAVFKGFQRELGRYAAVKVMAPHLALSGSARKRFAREARAAAAIVHPNVLAIHAVHASSRLPYLVMPFVGCESLQERIDRDGPLEVKEILRIGKQVAAGLAAAHAQGLVHRDVKPANILLEKGVDRAMLTDFGLARAVDDASLTRTGVIAGTPQFMSPEQARGESIDTRSDLFSLGSVIYAMCTGRPPFRAETSFGVLQRISDAEPRAIREINTDLPDWLGALVRKLHLKDPEQRFQTAGEVAELLESCLSHVQQPSSAPLPAMLRSDGTKLATHRHSRYAAILASAIAATCLVCMALFSVIDPLGRDKTANETSAPEASPPTSLSERFMLPRAAWNDDVSERIGGIQINADELESRAQKPWDESASSLAEGVGFESKNPSQKETLP